MTKKDLPLIGGHVSAAGGLYKAIENAEAIGADAIQIFGASPRQWHVAFPDKDAITRYHTALEKSRVQGVYLHAPYLVNLASTDEAMLKKSVRTLADHLKIANMIGANGLIFHLGSGKESPKDEAIKKATAAMQEVLKLAPGDAQLIMENAAGGGQRIGATPSDFAAIMDKIKSPRVKICIDTAHAFEAGLIEHYTPPLIKKMLDEWDRAVGLKNLVALHVNDSKTAFNSHHDRHENIGEGFIGLAGFRALAAEKRLHDKAWLLEVPGFAGEGPDKKNIDILRSCFA